MLSRLRQMATVLALLCTPLTAAQASEGPPEPALDANGDGSVDYAEMRVRRPDVTLKRFRALDRDGNGLISRVELDVALELGNPDALAIPPKANAEGKAGVRRKEEQAVGPQSTRDRQAKGGPDPDGGLSSKELSEVLEALDTDGDGKVSFEELRSGQVRAGSGN